MPSYDLCIRITRASQPKVKGVQQLRPHAASLCAVHSDLRETSPAFFIRRVNRGNPRRQARGLETVSSLGTRVMAFVRRSVLWKILPNGGFWAVRSWIVCAWGLRRALLHVLFAEEPSS